MIKDDTKDQIPLFDVPVAKKEEPPAPEVIPPVTGKTRETSSPKKPVRAAVEAPKKPRGTGGRTTGRSAVRGVVKGSLSGQVPAGDVRLTANIRDDLHLKLKITAARRRTTIGELIEELVEQYL